MVSPPTSLSGCILDEKNILVAGAKGCGKTSLIFTLARGIYPNPEWLPGRFEGWTIPAAALPKDILNDPISKVAKAATKPYVVNLTFWEDRPRLNLWEKRLSEQRQEERKAKEEAHAKSLIEDFERAMDSTTKGITETKTQTEIKDRPTLQRRSSQVSYATKNGITVPNYSKEQQKSEIVPLSQKIPGSSSNSVEDENEEDATILCSPRKLISYCDVKPVLVFPTLATVFHT